MKWDDIIGQEEIKKHLKDSIKENRVSHAQLFLGKAGCGVLPLALAYAQEIICGNNNSEGACSKQMNQLQHPDLHLSFPTINEGAKKALSANYIKEFISFVLNNPYQDLKDWYDFLQVQNKQGIINVEEIENLIHQFSIKSFGGGYKVQIIWMVERMNIESSNKLLKLLEEPPQKSLFILIAEEESKILKTIISRCQLLKIHLIEESVIKEKIIENFQLSDKEAENLAKRSDGDWNKAQKLIFSDKRKEEFEEYFIRWNRDAFLARKDIRVLKDIVHWSAEVSLWGREKQKGFLEFCSETFRQALLQNYEVKELVNDPLTLHEFKWDNFARFINGNNITEIVRELEESFYEIERNVNPKIVFLDMAIKLTRFLAIR